MSEVPASAPNEVEQYYELYEKVTPEGEYLPWVAQTQSETYLDDMRQYLGGLAAWQQVAFDDSVQQLDPPEHLQKPFYLQSVHWSKYLREVPDEQLDEFLEWQALQTTRANHDPENQAKIAAVNQHYEESIRAAVDAKTMPPMAIDALQRVKDAQVVIGDGYDLDLQGVEAYCLPDSQVIVIPIDFDESSLFHENNHLLGAMSFTVLDDAVVEHAALSLIHGNFPTVDPDVRKEAPGTYRNKRKLLGAVINQGKYAIQLNDVLEAHLEDEHDGPATQRLEDQVNSAYGDMDVKDFIIRQRDSIHAELQETFPQANNLQLDSAKDRYAAFALDGLSLEVHGQSSKARLKELKHESRRAAGLARWQKWRKDSRADVLQVLQMNALVIKRYVERLAHDELY